MNIKAGDVISIRHYSGVSPFRSVVLDISEESITVKLTKDFAIMNFLQGDPVVFGFEKNNEVEMVGCNIDGIFIRENTINLKIDRIESEAQKRQYERFPVSLYADIKMRDDKKKILAIIKDISYYGMLIYSKADFKVDQEIDIDIYMDKNMVFLKGAIARKKQGEHYYQFGLRVIYEDAATLNYMKEYLKRLKEAQEESIIKLKNNDRL